MKAPRRRLAFVSPIFLFPNDSGGKIRTTNILRGLKGGEFAVTLTGPATPEQVREFAPEIERVCDRFVPWSPRAALPQWRRAVDLVRTLPVNVAADSSEQARRAVREMLGASHFDVAVFDFVHAAVLKPEQVDAATVCFTHNVEAEIFERHAQQSKGVFMRAVWSSQLRKMLRFERDALNGFTRIVAVSDRDATRFSNRYGVLRISVIPTGVDLQHFAWQAPPATGPRQPPTVVFTGSMDWAANIDGVRFFLEHVWPDVSRRVDGARFLVVGRSPPAALVELGRAAANVTFTGYVDDIRPYVHGAQAAVIPLKIGGGTRIKAFEAMAMGCPLVSTSVGMEGLDVEDARHYLRRDTSAGLADAIVQLLSDDTLRNSLSKRARECVEARFSHVEVARVFERACLEAIETMARKPSGANGGARASVASPEDA